MKYFVSFFLILFLSLSVARAVELAKGVLGLYVLLADDTTSYNSNKSWTPALEDWQTGGSNVLWFTFINPVLMPSVPPSFVNFAKTRGTNSKGAIPKDTTIIFSIGGEAYSSHAWPWLSSPQAAESMANEVATWRTKYGCDGIDLDIESGAGDSTSAGTNLVHFLETLKQKDPGILVTQPVYGYPGVQAENDVVNYSWDKNGNHIATGADTVGIMVYTGTQSLNYVKNYAEGTKQWQGFPIKVDVATNGIITGLGGDASSSDIMSMVSAIKSQSLRGFMVWYASVLDSATGQTALQYGKQDDASANTGSMSTWANALKEMNS